MESQEIHTANINACYETLLQCLFCIFTVKDKLAPGDGVGPSIAWEDAPSDWLCPICGAPKEEFEKEG